jgi:AraC family transcriptional regulator, arabinose operon regulatory protein
MTKKITFFSIEPKSGLAGPIHTGHWVTGPRYGAVRRHGTQDWLLIYTVSGMGRLTFKGGAHLARPGDLALWFPGTFHDYRIAPDCEGWEIVWAHFIARPQWHDFMRWPQKGDGPRLLAIGDRAVRQQVLKNLEAMHAYATGPLEHGKLLALNALEKALLLADLTNPGSKQARLDPRVRRSLDMLCQEPRTKTPLSSVARACGLSLSRFAHLFSEQVGMTPVEYREHHRMLQARRLLETTTFSIKEIAAMSGFDSPFYFSRRFRKHVGVSPRKFREKR